MFPGRRSQAPSGGSILSRVYLIDADAAETNSSVGVGGQGVGGGFGGDFAISRP